MYALASCGRGCCLTTLYGIDEPSACYIKKAIASPLLLSMYGGHACDLEVFNNLKKQMSDEYPVGCKSAILENNAPCSFWDGIRVHSGSDTICKNVVDTLSIVYRSPFGVNTFEWVNMNNPMTVLSTDYFLPITQHGIYRVICTRLLSDGTTCSDIFFKTIAPPQNASIESPTGLYVLCLGDLIRLDAKPYKPTTPYYNYLWSDNSSLEYIDVNQPDKYYVTVTFLNGCKDVVSISVRWAAPVFQQILSDSMPEKNEVFYDTIHVLNFDTLAYAGAVIQLKIPKGYEIIGLPAHWSAVKDSVALYQSDSIPIAAGASELLPSRKSFVFKLRALNPCEEKIAVRFIYCPSVFCSQLPHHSVMVNAKIHPAPRIRMPLSSLKCKDELYTYYGSSSSFAPNKLVTRRWLVDGKLQPSTDSIFSSPSGGRIEYVMQIRGCEQKADTHVRILPKLRFDKIVQSSCKYPDGMGSIEYKNFGAHFSSAVWESGSAEQVRSGLNAGRYVMIIRDSFGCEIRDTTHIRNSDSNLMYSIRAIVAADCPLKNGQLLLQLSSQDASIWIDDKIRSRKKLTTQLDTIALDPGRSELKISQGRCFRRETILVKNNSKFSELKAVKRIDSLGDIIVSIQGAEDNLRQRIHFIRWYTLHKGAYILLKSNSLLKQKIPHLGIGKMYAEIIERNGCTTILEVQE